MMLQQSNESKTAFDDLTEAQQALIDEEHKTKLSEAIEKIEELQRFDEESDS